MPRACSASVTAQTGRLVLRTSTVTTHVVMRVCSASGEQHLLPEGSGFRLKLQGQTGACLILVGIGSASRAANVEAEIGAVNSVSAYFDDAARGWSRRWGKAFIWVPDTRIQALWARSVFFLLSSYAPDVRSPAAPMGWSWCVFRVSKWVGMIKGPVYWGQRACPHRRRPSPGCASPRGGTASHSGPTGRAARRWWRQRRPAR